MVQADFHILAMYIHLHKEHPSLVPSSSLVSEPDPLALRLVPPLQKNGWFSAGEEHGYEAKTSLSTSPAAAERNHPWSHSQQQASHTLILGESTTTASGMVHGSRDVS